MRKNKILTVYSIFVSIIFVTAIAFFGYNIYKEYSEGYARTRKTFDGMSSSIKKILRSSDITPDTQTKIANSIVSLDDYIFLEIKYNSSTIYMYSPKGFAPKENTNMIRLYFDKSQAGDNTFYINAAMYTLRPSSIAKYARTSFIVILTFTILTILLILYISIYANTSSSNETTEDVNSITDNNINDDEVNVDEAYEENENAAEEITDNNSKPDECKIIETENQSETADNESNDLESHDIGDMSTESTDDETEEIEEEMNSELPVSDSMPANIEKEEKEKHPEGLFSPATGFGWESYLMTRLENELVRATSLEFDLILFIIKIANVERTPELLEKLSTILVNTFQFKDLIFEYKEDGFAAIKTNCNIDDAIPLADKLHSDISTEITDLGGKCYIGLTSRTIRLVSADRLLKEADSALNHALEDENAPIIAFRANTERYLDFVERRN